MTETWNPTPEPKSQDRDLEVTDIVERLVTVAACGRLSTDDKGTLLSAADEIERLRAELDRIMPTLNALLDGN